jgi:hypothetical protein
VGHWQRRQVLLPFVDHLIVETSGDVSEQGSGECVVKIGFALAVALGLVVLCISTQAQAQQTLAPYEEHAKFTRAAQTVAPLTSELFGDQISLYSGATEFVVTDIDLPGNNGLPVQLRRGFKVEPRKATEQRRVLCPVPCSSLLQCLRLFILVGTGNAVG